MQSIYEEDKILEEEWAINSNLLILPIQKQLELFGKIMRSEYLIELRNKLKTLKERQDWITNRLEEIYLERLNIGQ
jgi:hypothetical protein